MTFAQRALAALLITASAAAVAAFPEKPIRVVIGFPAGGPLDQHARLLTERLQAVLGQPVIIDYTAEMPRWADAVKKSGARLD